MAKYKVGDKVRVRSDLRDGKRYFMEDRTKSDIAVLEMVDFAGGIVTIKNITPRGKYEIEENGWTWTDEMFEGLAKREFHVFDTVKHCKYGIGTVIEILDDESCMVDYDEWNEDFGSRGNIHMARNLFLTLIQAYSPN